MPSNTSSNKAVVPEAKGALDRFKYEVANELGVPLTDGYNGNLTSKQNGSVGGYMVKKSIQNSSVYPARLLTFFLHLRSLKRTKFRTPAGASDSLLFCPKTHPEQLW